MASENTAEWTQEAILRELRLQLQEQRPITLFNTYKGVPITSEAEIAMVSPQLCGCNRSSLPNGNHQPGAADLPTV